MPQFLVSFHIILLYDARVMADSVVFFFTDIEGSSALWEKFPGEMERALTFHDELLHREIEEHKGVVFKTIGDAFCATFLDVDSALRASVAIQRNLIDAPWNKLLTIRIRIAVAVGEAHRRDGDFFGPVLNRLARMLSSAHGGQIIIDSAASDSAAGTNWSVQNLGLHRLRGIQQPHHLSQLLAPELPSHFPPLRTEEHHPTNLSLNPIELFGRAMEIDDLLATCRRVSGGLITLTGPGGVGKTSLAVEVARRFIGEREGVFLVSLAAIRAHEQVVPAIAETIGLQESPTENLASTLSSFLSGQRFLLVLDNLEQIPGAGSVVAELLARSPGLLVIATSRALLHVRGEIEFVVSPLAVNDGTAAAVQLFKARAFPQGAPGVSVQSQDLAILQICRRLDGLPLAIELAAARTRVLSPEQILSKLAQRLPILTGGPKDSPARQQTLRNTIAWSFELLSSVEQTTFLYLAVCEEGWRLAEAEALFAGLIGEIELVDALDSLCEKHLLIVRDNFGIPRFDMLQTIREFALDQLAVEALDAGARNRHANVYRDLVVAVHPRLLDDWQDNGLLTLQGEKGNVRRALAHWLDIGDLESAAKMAIALVRFWRMQGMILEGSVWLQRIAERSPANNESLMARVNDELGVFLQDLGRLSEAEVRHRNARDIYGAVSETRGIAESSSNLAALSLMRGDFGEAQRLFSESRELFQGIGDRRGAAAGLNGLGMVAFSTGDIDNAIQLYTSSISEWREIGDTHSLAIALGNIGHALIAVKNYPLAESYSLEAVDLFERIGDPIGASTARLNLAFIHLYQGRPEQARQLFREVAIESTENEDPQTETEALLGLAFVAIARDEFRRATMWLGAAECRRAAIGHTLSAILQREYDEGNAICRDNLPIEEFELARSKGVSLTTGQLLTTYPD